MREDIRTIDLKVCIDSMTKLDYVQEIYLFGSRAYRTGSLRSDIDILIYAPDGVRQSDADELFEFENALDIFETVDKKHARSLVNDSRIRWDDLLHKIDAVLLWDRNHGYADSINQFKDMKLLREYEYQKTCTEIYTRIEKEFYAQFDHDAIFMIMPFADEYRPIYDRIKDYMNKKGYKVIRADERKFMSEIWSNVRLYLECCKRAIVLFPKTDDNRYNANVALEMGYMMSRGTPILLIKEKGEFKLFSDIGSVMYEEYDSGNLDSDLLRIMDSWIKSDLR